MASDSVITVAAAGDVATGHEPPESAFAHVLDTLRSADVRFAQVERLYSERGAFQGQGGGFHTRQPARMAEAFKSVPFSVLSIGSNHTGDWGGEAVEDTVDVFRRLGIPTVGAGRNIEEARRAAILKVKGLRIAFLGYVSVMLPQYWATESRAGSNPMRAHTFYEPYEYQPGAPARIVSVPDSEDLACLEDDVRKAKQAADIVFVSLHWGVHYVPYPAQYQPIVAHAAIDAGATVVLGHHAHQQQGMELYKDGVIFYSIGNFAFHRRGGPPAACMPDGRYLHKEVYSVEPEPGIVYDYRRHYNEGGLAFLTVDRRGLRGAEYVPTKLNASGQPELIGPEDPQFEKSMNYLNWAGKFISGGVTDLTASGDRYAIHQRKS
jgi:poly-gamma-glutamate capsule biosynthesis protein CapA/YwtB (metallophosphatase superfamily)